jgi:S-adenosylmethionine:tRNA ribosyltransferase-isomerase
MRTADFNYLLPRELIAQHPAPQRDQSRLLVLHRDTGTLSHRAFRDLLDYLVAGDVLVLNDSRVIPARLRGRNARTGGQLEVLLLEEKARNEWLTLLRPAKRTRVGTEIIFSGKSASPARLKAAVVARNAGGQCSLRFSGAEDVAEILDELGEVPLPPYIHRKCAANCAEDRERYQTVFARTDGSVAAPTAGLHFTQPLLDEIRARGVKVCFVTLHIGLATFTPVKSETVEAHRMHEERYEVGDEAAATVSTAKQDGRRVIAVGTTTVRVLESVAQKWDGLPACPNRQDACSTIAAGAGRTRCFIYPPLQFKIVDGLLTNFHLPRSTLLMLVSAFAAPGETRGRELILSAYAEAIRHRYRFYSYGDAMLIL